MDQGELHKELVEAKRSYIVAVRWLKETIGYKNLMSGSEWQEDSVELAQDSKLAFDEAKNDVLYYRSKLNDVKRRLALSKKKGKAK